MMSWDTDLKEVVVVVPSYKEGQVNLYIFFPLQTVFLVLHTVIALTVLIIF